MKKSLKRNDIRDKECQFFPSNLWQIWDRKQPRIAWNARPYAILKILTNKKKEKEMYYFIIICSIHTRFIYCGPFLLWQVVLLNILFFFLLLVSTLIILPSLLHYFIFLARGENIDFLFNSLPNMLSKFYKKDTNLFLMTSLFFGGNFEIFIFFLISKCLSIGN